MKTKTTQEQANDALKLANAHLDCIGDTFRDKVESKALTPHQCMFAILYMSVQLRCCAEEFLGPDVAEEICRAVTEDTPPNKKAMIQ